MSNNIDTKRDQSSAFRVVFACMLGVAVAAYTIAIVAGKLPEEQRIDAVHFGIIVIAVAVLLVLVKPSLADRLKRFEGAGFKLEMLEQVKQAQDKQGHVLDDISLMLPLLLPKTERKHLLNLDRGRTAGYEGNSAFRSEIRRLRSIGLLECLIDRQVGHMKSGMEFDLSDFVRLTDLGCRWVERIKLIEENEREPDATSENDAEH